MKIVLLMIMLFSQNVYSDVQIIGNKSNNVQKISKSNLHLIFTLRKTRWPNGERIVAIYLPKSSKESSEFAIKYLGMPSYKLYSIIYRLAKRNNIPIVEVENSTIAIKTIMESRNAIGYSNVPNFKKHFIKEFRILK